MDSSDSALISAATQFRVQILSPDAANHCMLFDETHLVDLSQSNGLFSINLGTINPMRVSRNPLTTYSLEEAIFNRIPFSVNGNYFIPNLPGLATSVPNPTDNRKPWIPTRTAPWANTGIPTTGMFA